MADNSSSYFSGPRIILWLANALIMVFLYFSQQSISELKGRVSTLESTRSGVDISLATLTVEQTRYARDLGEIKADLKGLSATVQALTVALERQQRIFLVMTSRGGRAHMGH